jgi:hypothetical protein
MKSSAKIPSPDKYAHPRKDFFDPLKKSRIYVHDRKAMYQDIEK